MQTKKNDSTDDFSVATTLTSQAEKIEKAFKMIMKCGKKIEALEKDAKEAKTVRLTPIPSAGSSSNESSALSRTSAIMVETLAKDVEVIKTKLADMSLRGNKNLDINSDNVAKWVEGKFEAFLKTPATRNNIRDIVTAKMNSFQVDLFIMLQK